MFTLLVIGLVVLLWFGADKMNRRDRPMYTEAEAEDRTWPLVLHIRQELKLIAGLLCGVIIMLGIIADRV